MLNITIKNITIFSFIQLLHYFFWLNRQLIRDIFLLKEVQYPIQIIRLIPIPFLVVKTLNIDSHVEVDASINSVVANKFKRLF